MKELDYSLLWGRMRSKHYSLRKLATAIGVTPTTLSFKMNDKKSFKQNEILNICKELDINESDIPKYFFTKM